MKTYKPLCLGTLILLISFSVAFLAVDIYHIIKTRNFVFSYSIPILIMGAVFFLIELSFFSSAVEMGSEKMCVSSALGYFMKWPPHCFRYEDITGITENHAPNPKFSNLKIHIAKKQHMIFIRGIQDYERMKKELSYLKPEGVELIING